MEDSQFAPQPEQESVPPANTVSPSAKRSTRRTVVIVAGVVVAAICLCIGICVVAGGWGTVTGLIRVAQERDDVTAVIDEFMLKMEKKDAAAAYALFSTRAQRQIPLSSIEEMLEGNNYVLFDGYESATVTNLNLNAAFNTNPDLPQGTVAKVTGIVTYEGGITGKVTATLEEENGTWRLHYINVTVPPSKLDSP
jgi:hypothetical protein